MFVYIWRLFLFNVMWCYLLFKHKMFPLVIDKLHTYQMALCWPDWATCEEYNPLQFLVVEEVVEGPEAPLFAKRVRVQIRVVAKNQYWHTTLKTAQLDTKTTFSSKNCWHAHACVYIYARLPVNVTAMQVDLLVDGIPQLRPQRVELLPHCWEQAAVYCIGHLQRNHSPIIIQQSFFFYVVKIFWLS